VGGAPAGDDGLEVAFAEGVAGGLAGEGGLGSEVGDAQQEAVVGEGELPGDLVGELGELAVDGEGGPDLVGGEAEALVGGEALEDGLALGSAARDSSPSRRRATMVSAMARAASRAATT
jgi:hypothetical protein